MRDSRGSRDIRGFSRLDRGWTAGPGGLGDREMRGRRGGRGGRGSSRPFDNGELRLVILALISEKPRHGYEIIKDIEDRFAGAYSPSPGVVYPTLTMLEELGNATVQESQGKKLYSITEQGRNDLAANRATADAALARMTLISGDTGRRGISPQIVRAMENMKLALRMRQRSGPLSEEQLRTIVNAIDAAALSIERS